MNGLVTKLRSILHIVRETHEFAAETNSRLTAIVSKMGSSSPATVYGGYRDQAFGPTSYAQYGQDLLVCALLHQMGITEVTYLDVGAHHPFNISNTALFHERGGRGINIEANPILFEAFPKARPNDVNLNVGVGPKAGALTFYMIDDWSGRNTFDKGTMDAFLKENPQFKLQRTIDIPVRPLDELLAEHAADVESIDFMSMDIEGMDTSVICAADLSRFRPKIICIETNSDASRQHLEAKEYELLLRIGGDNVYVAREHLGRVR